MFQRTTAINKLLALKQKTKVIQGGQGAGKNWGIIPVLIDRAIKDPTEEISIVTDTYPNLKKGAIRDFKKIMKDTNRWIDSHWHGTDKVYTFANGAFIEFFALDKADSGKGPRRTTLYVNECNRISFEEYLGLASRTSRNIWLDYNPQHEFWVHEEIIGRDNVDFIILTYLDNEAIPEGELENILDMKARAATSDYWSNRWKVFGLGQLGRIQTGDEWASEFSYSKHVRDCHYDPDLPIHVTFDQNSKPYMSALVKQIESIDGKMVVSTVKEYALKHPRNSTESVCKAILMDFEPYGIDGIYFYGDASGSHGKAKKRENESEHHYEVVEELFRNYMSNNSNRVLTFNPSLRRRRDFYAHLLSGYYDIEYYVDPSCEHFIADLEQCKEDANGGILKPKVKDENGATYEKLGHHLDADNYFMCVVFDREFRMVK